MSEDFELDSRLAADTLALASWPLCEVRLMNEARYPWVILVPRVPGTTELYQLSEAERLQLDRESIFLGQSMMSALGGHKLNVAALGNVVRQLHIHHIVRYTDDAAWPAPVWGQFPVEPMTEALRQQRFDALESLARPDW